MIQKNFKLNLDKQEGFHANVKLAFINYYYYSLFTALLYNYYCTGTIIQSAWYSYNFSFT